MKYIKSNCFYFLWILFKLIIPVRNTYSKFLRFLLGPDEHISHYLLQRRFVGFPISQRGLSKEKFIILSLSTKLQIFVAPLADFETPRKKMNSWNKVIHTIVKIISLKLSINMKNWKGLNIFYILLLCSNR